jgi:hypothetical protein
VYRWNSAAEQRDVVLLTGEKPGSEPETQALCQLIHQIHPAWVVSFHDPLACIEDPGHSELGQWLADAFALPLVAASATKRPALLAAGAPISACPASPPSFRHLRRRSGKSICGDDGSAALARSKMKHAGAEMQRRLNVHRQPGRAIQIGETRQRHQRAPRRWPATCRACSPASVQTPAPRLRARASASVKPPVLSSLILTIS